MRERLKDALYEIVRNMEAIDQQNTQDYGITVAQSYALLTFPRHESISMSDLSEQMRLAKSTMTRVIDQLVERGLVERETSAEDRRIVQVKLSEKGHTMQREMEADYQRFFEMVLAELDEPESVVTALEKLAVALVTVMQKKHGTDYQ